MLSYVAGFLLIVGVILLAGEILTRVVGATPLSVLNHLVGGVLGLCFMMAFVSLLLNSMEMIDKGSVLIPRRKGRSRFYNSVKEITQPFTSKICFLRRNRFHNLNNIFNV